MIIRLLVLGALIVLLVTVAVMIWQWWKARADLQALRENPPQRDAMLIRLPKEAEGSNVKMTRFFSSMERLVPHDPDEVAGNSNVISAALIGTGKGEGQAPQVKFLIWTPPHLTERVMMELQECYEGQAQVTELEVEDDPLGSWLAHDRQIKLWESQQGAQD